MLKVLSSKFIIQVSQIVKDKTGAALKPRSSVLKILS